MLTLNLKPLTWIPREDYRIPCGGYRNAVPLADVFRFFKYDTKGSGCRYGVVTRDGRGGLLILKDQPADVQKALRPFLKACPYPFSGKNCPPALTYGPELPDHAATDVPAAQLGPSFVPAEDGGTGPAGGFAHGHPASSPAYCNGCYGQTARGGVPFTCPTCRGAYQPNHPRYAELMKNPENFS